MSDLQDHHDSYDYDRRGDTAEGEAPFGKRFGESVSKSCSERARENVCGPKQSAARDTRKEVGRGDYGDQTCED